MQPQYGRIRLSVTVIIEELVQIDIKTKPSCPSIHQSCLSGIKRIKYVTRIDVLHLNARCSIKENKVIIFKKL